MAPLPVVYERCPNCGGLAATLEGELVQEGHSCPEDGAGPIYFPRTHHIGQITFVRGDWTNEELREQLDNARKQLADKRAECRRLQWKVEKVQQVVNQERWGD